MATRKPTAHPLLSAGEIAAQPASVGSAEPSGDGKPKADKWWKWVLLYPTLAISVFSSIPTYVELVGSTWLKVPFGQYKSAMKENDLWKDNIDCAAAPFDGLKNNSNVSVDAVVCQSGHVLVRVKPPEKKTTYKWVPLDSEALEKKAGFFLSNAYAERQADVIVVAQTNFVVVCQQWLGNGLVRRRILDKSINRCFDEVVNTYTGKVISVNPSSCSC